jgi:hypothetical protein
MSDKKFEKWKWRVALKIARSFNRCANLPEEAVEKLAKAIANDIGENPDK